MRNDTHPEPPAGLACEFCGLPDALFAVRCEHGPHFARVGCSRCDRHLQFLPWPRNPESLGEYFLPLGQHKGRRLSDVAEMPGGVDYLRRLAGQDWLYDRTREPIEAFLALHGATSAAEVAR